MEFSIQLSAYYPDHDLGGQQLYHNMLDQAVLADQLGYDAVSITEHHLINILLMPAPLQFAVKIASMTEKVKILTSVVVLPLHDMRIYAGEVVCADIFTDGRLMLGVGRGAFGFEMDRMGVPLDISREKFDESLDVLQALLRDKEVSWNGKYYQFDALTVMPRPHRPGGPPMMMGVLVPEAIYHCTKRGFHIQTTPLSGTHEHMLQQVDAFNRGKSELGGEGEDLTLTLSRVAFLARNEADKKRKTEIAHHYYGQFDNVYTGEGRVEEGLIHPVPRAVPLEKTAENLHICTPNEMIDELAPYAEAGVDRFILNVNFGVNQEETMECIQQFAEEVMPVFSRDTQDQKPLEANIQQAVSA
ncbi:MAG: LLM class flavin-dependent oxidoreductase [Granulosicoccus sp.]|nr:LLM class flavin-dependent oxidoreductase [Granulosicoccus sp.]